MDKTKKAPSTESSTLSSNAASLVADSKANQTPISSKSAIATVSHSARPSRVRIVQNFTLIWLDSSINESDIDFKYSLTQLRQIVNTIDTFTDADECVDFLTELKDEKGFMLVSGTLGQSIVPLIHDVPQLYSIYVFCGNKSQHEQWAKEWTKVKGVFTKIDIICDTLKRDTQQYDRDSTSITVTSGDLSRLDPSFMYTQLLKEILIEMDHDDKAKTEFTDFCRDSYQGSEGPFQIIDEFRRDYHEHTPIWWYTRDCFIYPMLNRALRLQEINTILKMGFFIRDLHQQIEQLYTRQSEKLTVYRGQGLSNVDFEKIRTKQGGLLSFNNFLSTSTDRQVSLLYAQSSRENRELTGILFQISIKPGIKSTPFASSDNVSYFSDSEKEILFSMHTVFRIGQVELIEDRLWRVELALTSDDDPELQQLTEHMRKEIRGATGWHRLGQLLIRTGNFD